ncbi:MAG: hypothetical protein ACAH80_01395 [Alphaproteobacteria bacterium]
MAADAPSAEKPADELVFVVEVLGRYRNAMKIPERKGLAKIFGRRAPKGWHAIEGSSMESGQGPLDHSTIGKVFETVAAKTAAMKTRIDKAQTPSRDDFDYWSETITQVWAGRKDQFVPRHFNPQELWTKGGATGARLFQEEQITAENLAAFIALFDTRDKRLADQAAQALAVKAAISSAVEPVRDVKPMKALQIRKSP